MAATGLGRRRLFRPDLSGPAGNQPGDGGPDARRGRGSRRCGNSCGYSAAMDLGGRNLATVFGAMNMFGNFGAALFSQAFPNGSTWFGWPAVVLLSPRRTCCGLSAGCRSEPGPATRPAGRGLRGPAAPGSRPPAGPSNEGLLRLPIRGRTTRHPPMIPTADIAERKKLIREQAHANRNAQAEQGRAEPGHLRPVHGPARIRLGEDGPVLHRRPGGGPHAALAARGARRRARPSSSRGATTAASWSCSAWRT